MYYDSSEESCSSSEEEFNEYDPYHETYGKEKISDILGNGRIGIRKSNIGKNIKHNLVTGRNKAEMELKNHRQSTSNIVLGKKYHNVKSEYGELTSLYDDFDEIGEEGVETLDHEKVIMVDDMRMTKGQFKQLATGEEDEDSGNDGMRHRNGIDRADKKWTNGIIPYEFHKNVGKFVLFNRSLFFHS